MPGAVNQKMLDRSSSEDKAKRRRRVLKQKVRRGEVLKLVNLAIQRYDRERRNRWPHRRLWRAYKVWDVRLSLYSVSLKVLAQRKLLEPVLDRVMGRTLIERD